MVAFGDGRLYHKMHDQLVCTDAATAGGFSIRGCLGAELGFMQAAGDVDPTASWVTGQVLLRARLSYRIARGLVIWTRPTFAINANPDPYSRGGTVVFDPEPIGGLFDLGFAWVFD